MGLLEASYQKDFNGAVLHLVIKGFTRLQAEDIARIALEYWKENHGRWENNT